MSSGKITVAWDRTTTWYRDKEHLDKLFMRKPDLPILKIRFPDGSLKAYWNTFYQKVAFDVITAQDFAHIKGMSPEEAAALAEHVKVVIKDKGVLESIDLEYYTQHKDAVIKAVCHKREFLGQMDLNAALNWSGSSTDAARKLSEYGAKILMGRFRLPAQGAGQSNFFNVRYLGIPGTCCAALRRNIISSSFPPSQKRTFSKWREDVADKSLTHRATRTSFDRLATYIPRQRRTECRYSRGLHVEETVVPDQQIRGRLSHHVHLVHRRGEHPTVLRGQFG